MFTNVRKAPYTGAKRRVATGDMFTVPVYSLKNAMQNENPVIGTMKLPEALVGVPVRKDILHRVVVWQLACKRKGTASTKTRAEKSGSGRKIHDQKGSGRARMGDIRNPMRRHGGTAHGPKPRDWSYYLPLKVQKLGIKCALSAKFAQKKLIIIDGTELPSYKTKPLNNILTKFGWTSSLIIEPPQASSTLYLAHKNIPRVNMLTYENINVYDILKRDYVLIHKDVITLINAALTHNNRQKVSAIPAKKKDGEGDQEPEEDEDGFVPIEPTPIEDLDEFYKQLHEKNTGVKLEKPVRKIRVKRRNFKGEKRTKPKKPFYKVELAGEKTAEEEKPKPEVKAAQPQNVPTQPQTPPPEAQPEKPQEEAPKKEEPPKKRGWFW